MRRCQTQASVAERHLQLQVAEPVEGREERQAGIRQRGAVLQVEGPQGGDVRDGRAALVRHLGGVLKAEAGQMVHARPLCKAAPCTECQGQISM